MGEEIAFESGRFSDFDGLVILTLTLDRVLLHTVMHHSSTLPTYQILLKSDKLLWKDGQTDGRTYVRTYVRTHGRTDGHLSHTIRSTRRSRPNKWNS